MKLVVVSDLHFDVVTHGVERFDEVAEALSQAAEEAIRIKATAFICLGDVCDPDRNLSPFRALRVLAATAIKLAANGVPSHWIAGNHDVIEDGSGATTLTPLVALEEIGMQVDGPDGFVHGFQDVHVHEQPGLATLGSGEGTLITLPYTPTCRSYDPAKWVGTVIDSGKHPGPLVVAAHLMIPGIIPGEETTDMPRGRDVLFPLEMLRKRRGPTLLLNGHYHRPQTFEGIHIPGSLARLTFGEEVNKPGYLVVEL